MNIDYKKIPVVRIYRGRGLRMFLKCRFYVFPPVRAVPAVVLFGKVEELRGK